MFDRLNVNKLTLLGIGLMFAAMQIVSATDVIAKWLSAEYSLPQLTWTRFLFQALLLFPIVLLLSRGRPRLRPLFEPRHILRGAVLLGVTYLFYLAIADNPVPDALALIFVAPIFVAVAAPILLKEGFQWWRPLILVIGLGGVLLVLQPFGNAGFHPFILAALGAAVLFGGYIMLTRTATRSLDPVIATFYAVVWGTIISTPWAVLNWTMPNLGDLGWMVLIGLLAAIGHYLIAKASTYANASVIAPLHYTEIFGATLWSYLFFGTFPGIWVWLGLAVIVLAGLSLTLFDIRRGKATVPAARR